MGSMANIQITSMGLGGRRSWLSERFLKWTIKRHYTAIGYKVSMRRIKLGNAPIAIIESAMP
jgi:hypothetical protein